ncbi:MAG: putative secreted protein [Myxococcaceae bacterium]|nr:putative secreted protein [Myxococcaceae bacterium]
MTSDAPLSVGLYTYSTQPRGSVVHCASLADALVAQGHSVTVYALAKPGSESFFRALEAQLVLIACEPAPADLAQLIEQRISEFARCVRELSPMHDVHHAQDCLAANALLRGRPRRGAVVRTVHHVEHFESSSLEQYQMRSICDSDLVLSVSETTQNDVQRHYGVRSERVNNGVEQSRFERPAKAAVAQLRTRLGLGDASPVMVSFGGIAPRKNTLRLLDAFLSLRCRVPSARWLLVGGASILEHSVYRDEFERRLTRASAADQRAVVCTGILSDAEVAASYGLADVVASPSLREGFGLCALEALAAGVPLVASRRAPFTEYLDDDCALLVDPEDGNQLLSALERALSSEGQSARIQAGIERARGFCWSRVADEHQQLYRALVAGVPARAFRAGAARFRN